MRFLPSRDRRRRWFRNTGRARRLSDSRPCGKRGGGWRSFGMWGRAASTANTILIRWRRRRKNGCWKKNGGRRGASWGLLGDAFGDAGDDEFDAVAADWRVGRGRRKRAACGLRR